MATDNYRELYELLTQIAIDEDASSLVMENEDEDGTIAAWRLNVQPDGTHQSISLWKRAEPDPFITIGIVYRTDDGDMIDGTPSVLLSDPDTKLTIVFVLAFLENAKLS